ncbi:MAG: hypothetical protein WBK26_05240 [Burkholderiaceae bacterium]
MSDMSNVADLARQGVASHGYEAAGAEGVAVRRLFMVLHGAYGAAFTSKFATGQRDADGKDKGIRSAMQVWQAKLASYPADVVEAAAGRVMDAHPEFPPTLPQFEALCRAAMPRKTFAQEQGLPRLPAPDAPHKAVVSVVPQRDGKDWARKIVAGVAAGDKRPPTLIRMARAALGLPVDGAALRGAAHG